MNSWALGLVRRMGCFLLGRLSTQAYGDLSRYNVGSACDHDNEEKFQ
jgi:hypothetical protein